MKILMILLFTFFSSTAMAANCSLPKGDVDFLSSRLLPNSAPSDASLLKTYIEPSRDCKTVRVWQYMPGKNGKMIVPTDKQCQSIQGSDFSAYPGLLDCTDYKVYTSEKEAFGKPLPHAYVKDGALVTRTYASFGGTASGVYLLNGHHQRVVGMMQVLSPSALGSGVSWPYGNNPGGGIGAIGGVSDEKAKQNLPSCGSGGSIGCIPASLDSTYGKSTAGQAQ